MITSENDSCIELGKIESALQIEGVTHTAAILAKRDCGTLVSPHVSNHTAREIFTCKNFPIALPKIRPCTCGFKTTVFQFNSSTVFSLNYTTMSFVTVMNNNFECLRYNYLLCFNVYVTDLLLLPLFLIQKIRDNSFLVYSAIFCSYRLFGLFTIS